LLISQRGKLRVVSSVGAVAALFLQARCCYVLPPAATV
jgi:hypothetical protein